MSPRYPVLLDLGGRACLVVGGGPVAERKARGLLAADAHVTLIAPEATEALVALAADGRLTWAPRPVTPADLASAPGGGPWAFVVAATSDRAVNQQVIAAVDARGWWGNDVSSPSGGPAALPAVHRDGPLTLAVATDGVHPGAAGWLRDLAAGAIGPEHLVALDLVAESRAASPAGARPDWRAAVDSGMLDLIREGHLAEAKERLQACLSSSSD